MHKAKFEEILRANGYHLTKARLFIFGVLSDAKNPLSMGQIIDNVSGEVDRVSVYRNIDLFEQLAIVCRIYTGWKYRLELSDQFTDHHHHLTCIGCGQIFDIASERRIEQFIQEVSATIGFIPRNHQLEIDGYCKSCDAQRDMSKPTFI